MEYYKLSLLRETGKGAAKWEKFYIKFEDNRATIVYSDVPDSLLNSKLEKISEEDAKMKIRSQEDLSYG